MKKTIEVNGTEYELSDNPSLRTVKHVQQMQIDMLRDVLTEEMLSEDEDELSEEEIMKSILDDGGLEKLQDMMWSRGIMEPAQTISLATDKPWDFEQLESLGAQDFIKLREESEEVLDGTSDDFFEKLGIDTSLMENAEMEA